VLAPPLVGDAMLFTILVVVVASSAFGGRVPA
jgi:hypothetical protein